MKARRRVGVAWRLAVMALAFVSAGADEPRADEPRTAESANKEDGGSDERALLERFRREFVEITPGRGAFAATFEMGRREGQPAEQPPHRVTVQRPFAIARYEVPQNLWQAVMGSNPSRWKGARNAVEMLSYDEAVDFCQKATERLRAARLIGDNQVVRLPSEAEWEYAARAGTKGVYSFGDDAAALGDYAWSTHNAAGNDPPVGAKKPNAWELYDVARLSMGMVCRRLARRLHGRSGRRLGLAGRRRRRASRAPRRQLERSRRTAHQQLSPPRPSRLARRRRGPAPVLSDAGRE